MFYIFGSPRSGTTLLAQCISSHPDLVVPDETDFIVPLAFLINRVRDAAIGRELIFKLIVSSTRFSASLGQYVSKDEIRACVFDSAYDANAIIHAIYAKLAEVAGRKMAGDKSPNDLMSMRMLIESGALGGADKVIHIVRDIRDLMLSLNRTGWAEDFDEYFPRIWSSTNLYLKYEMEKVAENYLLIRYEDFVVNPARVLTGVAQFMGVEYTDGMLRPENRSTRYQGVSHHSNLYNEINTGTVRQFETAMTEEGREKCRRQAGEAMQAFGYTE
ncbi:MULTISPECIES: sulfotransferase [unclassified Janthinobacterium]|uniref:sulfotransferase family protein n=1 Tax=unclassified Janthinobacterium TaxID=2610881 RepID=UPI001E3BE313|nr:MULTISPECIES: sulfotransferase [unclassified Janthinobacterium]MCC7642980.1 sulfotransferase [Janthinobacterium sp. EB271-G4-3-1]MCC7693056.1 sulfotransferase [Janthinobacterium sp. EB271-G4-3-2]